MPLCVQGGDVVLHHRLAASGAARREHVEVILPTVGLAVPLVEARLAERLAALGADEALRVPGVAQSRDAFLSDRGEGEEFVTKHVTSGGRGNQITTLS